MELWHGRVPIHSGVRWGASLGLAAALTLPAMPAIAQPEVQTSPIAATPANCAIHLSVANPNPGDQEVPRSLVMSGTALDGTATSGTGISQVQAFLGSRDSGGTPLGTAAFVSTPATLPGAWSLAATIPPNINGGQNLFVYSLSSASGQEAIVSIPIVVGEALTDITVPNTAQSFCPSVMAPTAQPTVQPTAPAVATPQPTAPATPTAVAPAAQPAAPASPTATLVPAAPANPPVAAPPPAAIQLSISSPPAPPLSFDTTTLNAPAGAQVTVTYTNNEVGVPHNWHLFNGPDSSAPTIAATSIMPGPGAVDTAQFTAPTQAGSYFFWCDVHPTIMTGDLVVDGTQ